MRDQQGGEGGAEGASTEDGGVWREGAGRPGPGEGGRGRLKGQAGGGGTGHGCRAARGAARYSRMKGRLTAAAMLRELRRLEEP